MNPAHLAAGCFRSSRFLHGYSKGKTRWDPAYPAVAEILRSSGRPLLDIGCGIGLLAAYLRECKCSQPILGIEPDATKVRTAKQLVGSQYPNLDFLVANASSLPDFSGDIVALDVLHYMHPTAQNNALLAISTRIAPGGCALIRTTFRDSSWRYCATLVEEAFLLTSGWIRGSRCHFPSRLEIENRFQNSQLTLSIRPMWGKTPFNSHLIEIRRPGSQENP